MPSDAFSTGLSLAVTWPASIAARARARLSNRPRSTSNMSARLRRGGTRVSVWTAFNPHREEAVPRRRRQEREGRSGQLHHLDLEILAERLEDLGDDGLGVEAGAGVHRVRGVVVEEYVGQHHRPHPQAAIEHAVLGQGMHDMRAEAADRAFL